jgi:DNA primase
MTDFTSGSGVSKAQIEDIKERIHIEDVVKRYVQLKHVGKNLFGLCPFHSEKTPSFSVNPELNLFKCYGCGEGGDVIAFLQKVESLEFYEAIEALAKEAGVTLVMKKRDVRESKTYDKAVKAHDLAAHYFQYVLSKHPAGKDALAYAEKRGLSGEVLSSFSIGYAPNRESGISLSRFLQKEGFTPHELIQFGLCTDKNGRCYDKFVDRLMFAIQDTSGTVIGFSGRVFRKNDDRPKYINSPETIIFQKRKQLFGVYQAKQAIRKEDLAILVEGQIDTISSWSHGIKFVLAPLGTGITTTQIERIKRFTNNLAISFDNDEAGERAHYKLAIDAYQSGFNVMSIEIPFGKDVDECISHDPSLWTQAVQSRKPAATYFLKRVAERYDPKTLPGKQAILAYIAPIISAMKDHLSIDHHVKELHLLTDIPLSVIEETLKSQTTPAPSTLEQVPAHPNPSSMTYLTYLVALLLQFPGVLSWASEKVPLSILVDGPEKTILEGLLSYARGQASFNASEFIFSLPVESRPLATDLLMKPLWKQEPSSQEVSNEISSTIKYLKIAAKKGEISARRKLISLAEQQDDPRKANEILNSINDTLKDLESLQSEQS